jgi:phage gp29-like protein
MTAATTPGIGADWALNAGANKAIQGAGGYPQDGTTAEKQLGTAIYPSGEPTATSLIFPLNQGKAGPIEPEKVVEKVTAQRVQQFLLASWNPLRGLSPELLTQYLEQHNLGFLRWAMLIWWEAKQRDDQLAAVIVKRELRPTDMEWEILPVDESPDAKLHVQALKEFYNNISVTDCLHQNVRGGVQRLIRLMMRAVGDGTSTFEIVWRPSPELLTAELRWVPPWFFEKRTGQLRFLPYELALQGTDLEPAGWIVHEGEGLFKASLIAFLYKQFMLKMWAAYGNKFGMPIAIGKTNAKFGDAEWEQFRSALEQLDAGSSILTTLDAIIETLNVASSGTLPHEPFVDRFDRAMGRIWNGGDLASMSRGGSAGGGLGSNPQMSAEDALAKADAQGITETLNFYVDRWVLRYKFGDAVLPKARFALIPPKSVDLPGEIAKYTFALACGVQIPLQHIAERFQIPAADPGETEDLAHAPSSGAPAQGGFGQLPLANISLDQARAYNVESKKIVARELSRALEPVRARIVKIQALDQEPREIALQKLRDDLPRLLRGVALDDKLVKSLEDSIGTALVVGATDAAQAQEKAHAGKNGHNGNRVSALLRH